jgi:hypothetical protein
MVRGTAALDVETPADGPEYEVSDFTTPRPEPLITPIKVPPELLLTGLGLTEDSKPLVWAYGAVTTPELDIELFFVVVVSDLNLLFVDCPTENDLSSAGVDG